MLRDEWHLSEQEAARCSAALLPGERVLLVTRPRVQLPLVEVLSRLVPGVVLLGGLGYMLWQLPGFWWLVAVIQLPFWLLAGFLLVSPRLQQRRRARTLYLLTDRRVVVLEPDFLGRERVVAYPLRPDPVREILRHDGGYGDIVFTYEYRWQIGVRIHWGPRPVGFIDVPEVEKVAALVAEQVAAAPAAAVPPPAALPPTLAGLPTETDSWGNPRPQPMNRMVMIAMGALFLVPGLVFVSLGVVFHRQEARFVNEGVRTTATVQGVRAHYVEPSTSHSSRHSHHARRHHNSGIRITVREQEPSGTWTYFPTLRFTDAAGVVHEFESSTGSPDANYPTGHQLEVVYLPADPSRVRLAGDSSKVGIGFIIAGSLASIIGSAFLVGGLQMKK